MASPTTPMHGKLGALYVLRPNGFSGNGLNDATWGTGSSAADLTYYEVVIDGAGTPDTFKWRVNGGAWTETVAITGAAQVLADAQTITFAATTGHTAADQWVIGNLKDEETTVATVYAQITDATSGILNPNAPPVWTPTNSVQQLAVNYTNGTLTCSAAPGVTTVTGNNGFIPSVALRKVAYLIDWSLNITVDMADASRMGQNWKETLPGQASATGSANAYFIGSDTLLSCLQEAIAAGDKYFLLQLFNYDPDQDQTGDHINAWVTFTSFQVGADIGSVVKEAINFQVHSEISFTANA
ncbi:MAG: hypothetical protein ABIJ57_15825 [Pseudomonadota bacterium]